MRDDRGQPGRAISSASSAQRAVGTGSGVEQRREQRELGEEAGQRRQPGDQQRAARRSPGRAAPWWPGSRRRPAPRARAPRRRAPKASAVTASTSAPGLARALDELDEQEERARCRASRRPGSRAPRRSPAVAADADRREQRAGRDEQAEAGEAAELLRREHADRRRTRASPCRRRRASRAERPAPARRRAAARAAAPRRCRPCSGSRTAPPPARSPRRRWPAARSRAATCRP